MPGKEHLHLCRQTTVAGTCLLNHPGHEIVRLDGIAYSLLKLSLQAVSLSQRSSISGRAASGARGTLASASGRCPERSKANSLNNRKRQTSSARADHALARVLRVSPRVVRYSSRASTLQLSCPFRVCNCASLGTSRAKRISRADSTPSSARRFGHPRPPPTASITAKLGLGSCAKI